MFCRTLGLLRCRYADKTVLVDRMKEKNIEAVNLEARKEYFDVRKAENLCQKIKDYR